MHIFAKNRFFLEEKFSLNPGIFLKLSIFNNVVYIVSLLGSQSLNLPSIYYYKFDGKRLILRFISRFYFKSFLSHLKVLYHKLFRIHFLKYKLRGLGYRIKSITENLIRIFIGTTNFFYIHIPLTVFVKVKRRRIILYSSSKNDLKLVSIHLLSIKKIIPYRLRGFFFPRQILSMKPGKKRF